MLPQFWHIQNFTVKLDAAPLKYIVSQNIPEVVYMYIKCEFHKSLSAKLNFESKLALSSKRLFLPVN
jgi:hypothetical protein